MNAILMCYSFVHQILLRWSN